MASSQIPKTMAGIQIEKTGGVEVLQYKTDLPVPEVKDGQVLIHNEYTGVNFIDTYHRTGLYKMDMPMILGRESAGTIVALPPGGSAHGHKVGDRVAALANATYAQYTAANESHVHTLPDSVSFEDGAASLLQGLTALTLIEEAHKVRRGDWVLIHAAAGGMGLWLCQLLKSHGAHVIGTASSPEKRKLAQENGAEHVFGYDEEELKAKVKELTDGNGVIAVFDGVGKSTFDVSLECLARKGTMVSFGNASGAVPPQPLTRLATKNIKLCRPVLFQYIVTRQEFAGYTKQLFDFLSHHQPAIQVHKTYDLKDAAAAHNDLEGRKTTGKLLLKP